MQIPTFKMLNEHLIADINKLNEMFQREYKFDINTLTARLSVEKNVNENFDAILKFLEEKQTDKELTDQQKILLNGVFLYAHNYIMLNNIFAKHLDKNNNFDLNAVVVDIFHTRYEEMKSIFNNEDYKYITADVAKLTDQILAENNAQAIGKIEEEIFKNFPKIVETLITDKKITQKDDIVFSSFSIGSGIIQKYLNDFFKFITDNSLQPGANKEAQQANPEIKVENPAEKVLTRSVEDYYKDQEEIIKDKKQ